MNLIDEAYAPPGALHLGHDGWIVDRPERISIRTYAPVQELSNELIMAYGGLLGEGQLQLIVFNPDGRTFKNSNITEYECSVFFIPKGLVC